MYGTAGIHEAYYLACSFNVEKRTHKILLIRIFRVKQMDETTHEALLLSKILRVRIVSWLVWLVLY